MLEKPSLLNIGILGSTRGTNLVPIVEAISHQRLSARISIVISNKADALILKRAASYALPTEFIDPTGLSREEFDKQMAAILHANQVDLIVLIGYMRILSSYFVTEWKNKIINVHPSLLPAFAGMMDLDVHRAVLASGVTETGCTVHYVTEEVDAGPLVVQKKCRVLTDDSPELLKARVQQLEGEALVAAIAKIAATC